MTDLCQLAMSETGRLVNAATRIAKNIADLSLGIAICLICFYAFASRSGQVARYLARWLPMSMNSEFEIVMTLLDRSFAGFFRGRFLIALFNVLLFSLAWMATGVSFWLLFGIVAAFFNIVPYLSIVVWLAAMVVNYGDALIRSEPLDILHMLVWPTIAFGAVHIVEGWLLTPLVQSKEVNLSAPTILVAITTGGMIGGVVGLLLAVPLTASCKMLAEKYLLRPEV